MASKDFLFNEDFLDYRIEEAKLASRLLNQLFAEKVSPDYYRGAIKMLKIVVSLPDALAKTPEAKALAKQQRQEMVRSLHEEMLRLHFVNAGEE